MKFLISKILLLLCVGNSLFAQYNEYYNTINEAHELAKGRKYAEALDLYEVAFKKVNFVKARHLYEAFAVAAKSGTNKEKAEKYLLRAFCRCDSTDLLDHYMTNHSPEWQLKLNEYKVKNADCIVDKSQSAFRKELDGIKKIDLGTHSYAGEDLEYYESIRYGKILSNIIDTEKYNRGKITTNEFKTKDSLNFLHFVAFISKNGYPDEREIGRRGEAELSIVVAHADTDSLNIILKPALDTALVLGKIQPSHYGWVVDRRLVWLQHREPYYYWMVLGVDTSKLTAEQIAEINRRRKTIGLPLFPETMLTYIDIKI